MFRGVDQAIGEVIIHTTRMNSVRQRTEAFSSRGENCGCVGLVRRMVAEKSAQDAHLHSGESRNEGNSGL